MMYSHIWRFASDRELKKGNAELLILALLEDKARHGYEIGKLIAERSAGVLRFHVASLYPLLYRLERRGWVKGDWEPAGGRRRRYYRLTPTGRKILGEQRSRFFWSRQSHRGGPPRLIGKRSFARSCEPCRSGTDVEVNLCDRGGGLPALTLPEAG